MPRSFARAHKDCANVFRDGGRAIVISAVGQRSHESHFKCEYRGIATTQLVDHETDQVKPA